MKTIKYILLIVFIFTLHWVLNYSPSHKDLKEKQSIPHKDSIVTINISAVGDLMCHSTQYWYAKVGPDKFDFKPVYREIKKYIEKADLTIGNLETVIGGKELGYSGFPVFNTPDDFLEGLKYAGFDILVTANNHADDKGNEGVLRTIKKIKEYGMDNSGTYSSEQDRDSVRIYNMNGINISLFSYTYGTNGDYDLSKNPFLINIIDTTIIKQDIKKAKEKKTDLIIVYFHFGDQYIIEPSIYQSEIVNKTIDYGADIILATHPHVLQPISFYKTVNSKIDSGFVTYSLGNFISNQRWRYSDGGTIISFSVTKNISKDSVYVDEVSYLPIWVFKGKTKYGKEFVILPAETAIQNTAPVYVTKADIDSMKQCFFDTKDILTSYSDKVKLFEYR